MQEKYSDETGYVPVVVIVIVLLLAVTVSAVFLYSKNHKTFVTSPSPLPKPITTSTPTPVNTVSPTPQVQKVKDLSTNTYELKEEISKIIDKDLVFTDEQKSGVESYEKDMQFEYTYEKDGILEDHVVTVYITVYKYVPGQIMYNYYEGPGWYIKMDNWVRYLSNLKVGQTTAVRVTSWGEESESKPILVKKLGGRVYGIYDWFFKPAGSYDHYYATYDKNLQRIIVINAYGQFLEGVEYSKTPHDLFTYPKSHQVFIDWVESAISSLN